MSREQRSVAFAWSYTGWGGAEIQMLHLARYAPPGTEITVIAPQDTDEVLRTLWSTVPHRWIDLEHHTALGEPPVSARRIGPSTFGRLRRLVGSWRAGADLVRAARGLPEGIPLVVDVPPWSTTIAVTALTRKRRVVLIWHTPLPELPPVRGAFVRAKLRTLGRLDRLTVAASSDAAGLDAAHLFGRDVSEVTTVPNGFGPDEIAAAAGTQEDEHLVVGAGALVERKGVDTAIDAIGVARSRGCHARLIWLGDGDRRAALEGQIADGGLGDAVRLRAPVPSPRHRIEMLRTIAGAAVYVQPSRVDGLPTAVIEAMALGRPVVATKVGAMHELGDDAGVTWVPVDDADALGTAVATLLDDPTRRRELGARGRALVETRWNMAAIAPEFLRELGHPAVGATS